MERVWVWGVWRGCVEGVWVSYTDAKIKQAWTVKSNTDPIINFHFPVVNMQVH